MRTLVPVGYNWIEVEAAHCHFVDVNPSSIHPQVRKTALAILRQDIEFAAQAGARLVVMHPCDIGWFDFYPPGHPLHAEGQQVVDDFFRLHTEVVAESLAELGRFAAERGILLTFENM